MNNNLSISFLASAIIIFVFYLVLSLRFFNKNVGESIKNTFPFESNKRTKIISLLALLIASILGILFIVFLYPLEYRFGFQVTSMVGEIIALICFFLLNFINLYREKIHYMIFCIMFVATLCFSISLGGAAFYFYNLLKDNIFILIVAIFYFVIAIAEVLYVVPNLSVSLRMVSEKSDNQTILKKPHFVKLAFLEWLLGIGILLKPILMLIVIIVL